MHTKDNRLGGMYSFNYDVLRKSMVQQRISAFYNAQCCGLAMEYQTYNYGAQLVVAGSGRPPLLHVVHARRPRQLLAVQRGAQRRAKIAAQATMANDILVTGAAGFAGSHLIDLLVAAAPRVAWHRPGGSPPREQAGVRWDAVDLLDRAQVQTAIARVRPAAVYHCAGAAHVGRAWEATDVDLRDQRARHPPSAAGAGASGQPARGSSCRARRSSTRPPTRR